MKNICLSPKIFVVLLVAIMTPIEVNAESLKHWSKFVSPFELKGKMVIIPSYDEGYTDFHFVYVKESFYTGKTSKKMRSDEQFIGVPIKIVDVQLLNKGKSSEKFCLLFSKDDNELSVVVPLCVTRIKDDMEIFQKLFYHLIPDHAKQSDPYTYRSDIICFLCYDYEKIKFIEDNFTDKVVCKDCYEIKKGMTFVRFLFKKGNWFKYLDGLNYLYAEFSDGVKSEVFEIKPIGAKDEMGRGGRMYELEEIVNLF